MAHSTPVSTASIFVVSKPLRSDTETLILSTVTAGYFFFTQLDLLSGFICPVFILTMATEQESMFHALNVIRIPQLPNDKTERHICVPRCLGKPMTLKCVV